MNRNSWRRLLFPAVVFLAATAANALAQVSVTTWHNDIGRTGQKHD
jgi:hypothetical protein